MATFVIRPRQGRDIAVEGALIAASYPQGTHTPVVTVYGEARSIVAIVPGDAITAVYRKDAEKEAGGGPVVM